MVPACYLFVVPPLPCGVTVKKLSPGRWYYAALKKKFRFIFMCECFAYVYICTRCKPGDHGNQKKASDPLERELYVVVSCCVGAGNQVQVFRKSNSAFHHWAISPALAPCFLDTSSFYSLCNVLSFVYFVKIIENTDSQEVTSCVELWLQVSRGTTAC